MTREAVHSHLIDSLSEHLRRPVPRDLSVVVLPHFCVDNFVRCENAPDRFLSDVGTVAARGGGNLPVGQGLTAGGKAANTARALSALGVPCTLIARTNELGYALLESFRLVEEGGWTDSLAEYLLPTAPDMPAITPVVLEHPDTGGPYGARGVGEMGVSPVAPAIANAVAEATGVRVTRLPIAPECLLLPVGVAGGIIGHR